MKSFFSFLLLLCLSVTVFSQTDSSSSAYQPVRGTDAGDKILSSVEQAPEFAGGQQGLINYLSDNIHYPADARAKNKEGRVVVRFVVCTDGSLFNETIVKSVDSGMDQEVLRVVKAMPKWKPGKQNGVPVKTYYTLPVSFKLQGQEKHSDVADAKEYPSKKEAVEEDEKIYTEVEHFAEFPGGMPALQRFLGENVKYPPAAIDKNITGKAIVRFIVGKDGTISDIVIQKDVPNSGFGAEAVRVVNAMPKWNPGTQDGQPVKTYYTLPVTFKMEG